MGSHSEIDPRASFESSLLRENLPAPGCRLRAKFGKGIRRQRLFWSLVCLSSRGSRGNVSCCGNSTKAGRQRRDINYGDRLASSILGPCFPIAQIGSSTLVMGWKVILRPAAGPSHGSAALSLSAPPTHWLLTPVSRSCEPSRSPVEPNSAKLRQE